MVVRRVSKRRWHDLELICSTGVGIAAIAPHVSRTLREIVGADAGAIFWMDAQGLPTGFFHEDTHAGARDLFANAFERLFLGESELNVATLARRSGADAGHLLAPPPSYWKSNTFNLLVRPSGHHHAIDLRIDHEGVPRAVVLLFRVRRRPFDEADLALLRLSAGLLRRAFVEAPGSDRWTSRAPPAHLLVDRAGGRLLFASASAHALLQEGNHVAQGVPATGPLSAPPAFAAVLCARLGAEARPRLELPSPNGRLVVVAEELAAPAEGRAVLLTLQPQTPFRLGLVERILEQDVSPKQKTLLLAAASGASRTEAARLASTSPEAMKKHLLAIFAATGARSWIDLGRMFGAGEAAAEHDAAGR
ncbi:hypothetical protein [Xanthobacter sediminis]|uniref:hypothetical protein n=1 Tax=Xanthobacter sediminis TaxID=3119926 RepID=UPI00372A36DB